MSKAEIATFDEFWDFYVREHANKLNRTLHFVGSTAALACVATALVTRKKWLFLAAPVVGYGFAWTGHFFVEKNKPATFTYPLWSLAADWKMWAKILDGTMDAEVERVLAHEANRRAEAESVATAAPIDPSIN